MLIYLSAIQGAFSTKSTVKDADILKIATGDIEAFESLYTAVKGSVYGFALSITKNTHDAEDILQDTMLKVYSAAPSYSPQGKPLAWVLTIAKNEAFARLRRKKEGDLEGFEQTDDSALAELESVEDKELIKALLNGLDQTEREIIMLKTVSGLKFHEIAKILEITLNTVISKHHRALKKLKSIAESEGV